MAGRGGVARALLLVIAGVLVGVADARSQPSGEPLSAAETAEKFLAAFRAKDEAAMKAALELADLNAFPPADWLFGRHVEGSLRDPPQPGDFLDAALALAGRAKARKGNEGLPGLVEAWKTWGREDLEREARLRTMGGKMNRAVDSKEWESVLSLARESGKDLAASPPTVTTFDFPACEGEALEALGRLEEASAAYGRCAEAAVAMRWPRAEAYALSGVSGTAFRREEYGTAIAAGERRLAIKESLDDRPGVADALGRLGDACLRMNQLDRALGFHERCRKEREALGDRRAAAKSLSQVGDVQFARCEFRLAREAHEAALKAREALGDHTGVAFTAHALGNDYGALGEFARALECYERSIVEWEAVGNRLGAVQAHTATAEVFFHIGCPARALEIYEQFLPELEALGDRRDAARVRGAIGVTCLRLGQDEKGIASLELAIEESRALRDRVGLAAASFNYATYCPFLPPARQEGLYRKALEEFEAIQDRVGVSGACLNLGNLVGSTGRRPEQRALYERALRESEAIGDRATAWTARLHLANLETELGNPRRALELYGPLLKEAEALGNRNAVNLALLNMGESHNRLGEPAKALPLLGRALEGNEAAGDRGTSATVLVEIARARLALGSPVDALRAVRRAVEIRIALCRGLAESQAYGQRNSAHEAAGIGIEAARALADAAPAERPAALREALWCAEAGRGLLLAEGLVNRNALLAATVRPALVEAEALARGRITTLQKRLLALASTKDASQEALAAARAELDAAYPDLEAAVARIQREARRVAEIVYPAPADLETLRAALPPTTALLLYEVGKERAFALVLTRETLDLQDLGAVAEITNRLEAFLRAVSVEGGEEEGPAAALYEALLRPIEKSLAGKTRLLVSPDGPLAFLPFEALLRVEGAKRERAIERWEISCVPSGTVYAALREEAARTVRGEGLLALGDPVYPGERPDEEKKTVAMRGAEIRGLASLPRLQGSADEVRALADLFPEDRRVLLLREDASAPALSAALGKVSGRLRALHLACHGHLDAERPRLTGLVLSGGEVLSLDDVYRLRVPADLVVLSACETGRGKVLPGEGVVGLVRGFFFAGAPRVVVSNWKVSDESARALMVSFYGKMVKEGLAPGAALRAAKREMLRAGGPTAHPSHWAAFVMWGLSE